MSRVSLILPTTTGDPCPDDSVSSLRASLENAGHSVEVIITVGPGSEQEEGDRGTWRMVHARNPGLASSAMAGLEVATGDYLIVMDPRMGYAPESLPEIVSALESGAELALVSRFLPGHGSGWLTTKVGGLARPFTGTTDPLTGLVGITRRALDESFPRFRAVGSRYSLEFLSKIPGRRVDLPSRVRTSSRRGRPGLDDVRHLKRLADHQYGNASRLIQFCVVGASGMVVDLTCYYIFQKVFNATSLADRSLPMGQVSTVTMALAAARVSAIAVALVWNFSLNRRLTFSYARQGSVLRQFATYVASNLLGVLVSLTLSLGLPERFEFFRDHKLVAAVAGIVAATGISFSMSRWVVFRTKAESREPAADQATTNQGVSVTESASR